MNKIKKKLEVKNTKPKLKKIEHSRNLKERLGILIEMRTDRTFQFI